MSSETEVAGKYVIALLNNAGKVSPVFERKTREYLEENSIEDPQPDNWYPLSQFVESLHQLEADTGENTLKEAGREMAKDNDIPDDKNSIEEALEFLGESHKMAHRNGTVNDYGMYRVDQIEGANVRMSCTDDYPYPASLAGGVVASVAELYGPTGIAVAVNSVEPEYDEKCAFELTW